MLKKPWMRAFVPLCLCASVSLCLCVFVPLCLCASVSLCLCVFVPLCLCASVSFGTRFGFEPSGHCKITHPVYCPHAAHKKNAGPVVPAGESGYSSLLLFSDYPTVPNADISCPDTFSVTRTAIHDACQ